MKGGFELNLTVGVIIFATAILTMWIVFETYYVDFAGVVKIPVENLEVVEASHSVESCLARLSANERFILKNVLVEYAGDSINRICEIREPIIGAYVDDTEDKLRYLFPPPDKNMLESLFPPAMVDDLIEQIRRWTSKQVKTKHSIWVSIIVPEMKKVTDKNEKITGEFLVQARWEGLGSLKANDIILKLYSRNYYKNLPVNVQTIPPSEVIKWVNEMEDKGIKFDSRIVSFQDTPVTSIIPHELVDCDKVRILDLVNSEACVEIFEKIDEIHMGRLYVEI